MGPVCVHFQKFQPTPFFKHLVSQNGVLTRVEDIIEKEEWNVNKPDEQDVPLLHWASINNRQEVRLY